MTGKIIKPVVNDELTAQKKSSQLSGLLVRYVTEVREADPLQDLWRFYGQPYVLDALFAEGKSSETFLTDLRRRYSTKSKIVSFADLSVLLRLCQLCEKDGPIRDALGWYAHIIVDEGQDLSLLELEAILAATDKRNSITLSADSKQKIPRGLMLPTSISLKRQRRIPVTHHTVLRITFKTHTRQQSRQPIL